MSLVGQWEQQGTFENMDAFLTTVGMEDPQVRGMISGLKTELHFSQDGDQWQMEMITPRGSRKATFANGDEIDYVSIVGRPVKSTMHIDGNKLIETHADPTNPSCTTRITREVTGDEMLVVLNANGTEAKVLYKRAG